MKSFYLILAVSVLLLSFQNCTPKVFQVKSSPDSSNDNVLGDEDNQPPAEDFPESDDPTQPPPQNEGEIAQIEFPESPLFGETGPFTTDTLNGIQFSEKPILAGGTKKLLMNIWYPNISNPSAALPVIVYIHGGGWMSGDQNNCLNFNISQNSLCRSQSARGYVVVSITYRLSGEAKFPAQIHDVRAALKYLKTTTFSQFKIDKNRIGVIGSSAGGHLATLLGTSTGVLFGAHFGVSEEEDRDLAAYTKVAGVVGWFSPTDLKLIDEQMAQIKLEVPGFPNSDHTTNACSGEMLLLSPIVGEPVRVACGTKQTYSGCTESHISKCNSEKANPVAFVNGNEPPFLLRHSYLDKIVPYQQSLVLKEALESKGIFVDYKRIEKQADEVTSSNGLDCADLGHNFHTNIFDPSLSPRISSESGRTQLSCAYREAIQSCDSSIRFFDKYLKGNSSSAVTCL